jgi:hypothetical protein
MYILTVPWDLRSLWAIFTVTAKLHIVCLLAATVYTVFFLARTLFRLHRAPKHAASVDATRVKTRLFETTKGIDNLRQFHTLLFLLSGVSCANEMFATLRTVRYSSMSLSAARIDVFEPVVALAFFVFSLLALLYGFQWTVAAHLQGFVAGGRNHAPD